MMPGHWGVGFRRETEEVMDYPGTIIRASPKSRKRT